MAPTPFVRGARQIPQLDSIQWSEPNSSFFVGSPDQIVVVPSAAPAVRHSESDEFTPRSASPTRSGFGIVIPSSMNSSTRSLPSRVRQAASSLRQSKNFGRPMVEREWTVFGQLMENDGELKAQNRQVGNRRRPARLSVSTSEESQGNDEGNQPYGHTPSDYDSSSSPSPVDGPTPATVPQKRLLPWFFSLRLFALSPLQRNILKCSVAYFIASLFTFLPHLSGFLTDITSGSGNLPSPSGHMVATVAVYFNPAKTVGGMLEADRFCLLGVLFAAFVSVGSMSMYWWLEVHHGFEWLADVLVILWIGLGMSGVAWMKVWMANPSFNTACSMTTIILFIVVVKEGGAETLLQVSLIVLVGAIISNVTCLLLWPQTATTKLQDNMTKTLDSFSTLLQKVISAFLLEEPLHRLSQEKLQKAVDNHQASFISLKNNLEEARSELLSGPAEKTLGIAYEDAVDSMNRLAQHLNGLRSGSRLQYDLAKANRDGKLVLKTTNTDSNHNNRGTPVDSLRGKINGKGKLVDTSTEEVILEGDETTELLKAAANMFGDLVEELGPPMKSLSTACITSLKRLKEAFLVRNRDRERDISLPQDFDRLMEGIERALYTFDSTSNHAVMRLYKRNELSAASSITSYNSLSGDNLILTSGNDHENVFLVYFFIFTLQEFASELLSLVDAMCRIITHERAAAARSNWFIRVKQRISGLVTFFRAKSTFVAQSNSTGQKRNRLGLTRRLSSYLLPWAVEKRPRKIYFPKVRPHAPNTIQTPGPADMSFGGRVKRSLWAIGARLKEPDLKYAFKAGMATAILAAPAFFETTRPVFMEYRGEWALISFFVVMSPTIGATNFLSVHRVLGTLFGAATAAAIWSAFPQDPVVLAIFGFFFSIPCFYYIVAKPKYATSSRFVLLTYNLTCLFCYNLRMKDISVINIAFHRSVAVTVGVVWAGLVSRYWWPAEARRELSRALGEFCLNMGWLYTRLVAYNSFTREELNENSAHLTPTETTTLLKSPITRITDDIHEFMSMELHLQIKLIELQGLLAQTAHEPRLKGPFPIKLYRSILTSLQSILDKLHSMRCVTSREEWHTSVHRDFIIPVNKERREMVGNIILYFSVLSSAFRLKAPLPPYLPPAERAQQSLVDAIRKLDVVKNREVKGSRQLLFFAYALTMKGVIQELDFLGKTLQDAFGVIGQSTEEFEALFRVDASSFV